MKRHYDFVVVGAGIFGVSTALALIDKKYSVALINPDDIPHPLAASTDISKVVRMEYDSDLQYMDMVIECLDTWRHWNAMLARRVYHEVGYLLLSEYSLDDGISYESTSYQNLLKKDFRPERLSVEEIAYRFPAFRAETFVEGMYHAIGGYAEAGKTVELLARLAEGKGVELLTGSEVVDIIVEGHRVQGVRIRGSQSVHTGQVIVCAGNFSPYLVPDLKPFMRITGHPVFHLVPTHPETFQRGMPVFGAGISSSGWYGFPLHPSEGVVKVAHHGNGRLLDPRADPRVVDDADHRRLHTFIERMLPALSGAGIVYTRMCCYTDTLDGHFWIDKHPEIAGLTIGTGGSGHGFKMAPVIGQLIAGAALEVPDPRLSRFRWRDLSATTANQEEARSKVN